MIGVFLPVMPANRRASAYRGAFSFQGMVNSTHASIVGSAETSEYPRNVSVYTIRTPSPGGQFGVNSLKLLAFFFPDRLRVERGGAAGGGPVQSVKETTLRRSNRTHASQYSALRRRVLQEKTRCSGVTRTKARVGSRSSFPHTMHVSPALRRLAAGPDSQTVKRTFHV